MRAIGSSCVAPYSAMAGAAAALYGPLHGGANEEVLKMLSRIDDTRNIPEFIQRVKNGEGKLMGFGHRVYKNYDPRARIIKRVADEVFEVTGRNRLLDIALELERIALEDEYFISRKLYPNVDFYSGIIYQAMGLPDAMFPVMFAIPRTVGWLAQWQEMVTDPEQKITRPRQIFVGQPRRELPKQKAWQRRDVSLCVTNYGREVQLSFSTVCGAGLLTSSWALTFCKPAVSASIAFCCRAIIAPWFLHRLMFFQELIKQHRVHLPHSALSAACIRLNGITRSRIHFFSSSATSPNCEMPCGSISFL